MLIVNMLIFLKDESTVLQALDTNNPMVAEILMHLNPNLEDKNELDKTCLDIALERNLCSLYVIPSDDLS